MRAGTMFMAAGAAGIALAAGPVQAGTGASADQPTASGAAQPVTPISPLRAEALEKARELNDLVDGNWDQVQNGGRYRAPLVLGVRGRWICDLERYRRIFAELYRINDEARAVARGARLAAGSGAPGLVDPAYATREADLVQNQVALWDQILEACERQNMTISSGQPVDRDGAILDEIGTDTDRTATGLPPAPATGSAVTPAVAPPTSAAPSPPAQVGSVATPTPTPTPSPTPPPPPGLGNLEQGRAGATLEALDPIRNALDEAERARRAGDCPGRTAALQRASVLLRDEDGTMAVAGVPGPLRDSLFEESEAAWQRPCPPPGYFDYVTLEGMGGFHSSGVPRTNYGFFRAAPGEPDLPAAFSNERIPMLMFGAAVRARNIGRFSIYYAQGDASNGTVLPVSTTGGQQGTVNTDNAPSGSTGGAANRGLNVVTETELEEVGAAYRYTFLGQDREPAPDTRGYPFGPIHVSAGYVELSADYRDREHRGVVDIPGIPADTPPVIRQVLEQDVTELEIGLAVGVEVVVPVGDDARLTLGVQGGIQYYDYDLASVQTNTQLVGGPEDRDYTLRIDDSESGITYHGDAIAELSVRLSGSLELFAQGRVGISGARAQVINPFSGDFVQDGGTTFLETDEAVDYTVLAGFRIAIDWGD